MNIIEKLEIKSIEPVKYSDDETLWVGYNPKDIDEIEEQNRELLQALIKIYDAQTNPEKRLHHLNNAIFSSMDTIIKATDKDWPEIKKLL